MTSRLARLPKQATRAQLRQRAVLFLHQHPRPETVTVAQLVGQGVSEDVAREILGRVG